ncbi:sensor histidine kinase [Ancylobacter sp. TS-1]|uniref:sensor histidine kinase n=1 Tax=Ancylobacter sp. TS-1 TaxID=1850374 RepID=UPI001265D35B|nr:PAS domain-containing sensor histidine kinase [Ancylobacter sp. TS-1]QFR33496.1 PAS domain-containing protein [Ancylobacter sp. TS-1]
MNKLAEVADGRTLAKAIVNTIPEPFLVLDDDLRALAANRSFYDVFKVEPARTIGTLLYALGDGQWNIPALRELLETIIPTRTVMDDFEVEHDFPGVGRRTMLLNGRKVLYDDESATTILLAFRDITERRAVELERRALLHRTEELVRQQQTLLQEMEHRVLNSLQIIASILMLKARAVTSDETRHHLEDAHQRVMSVAAVQRHLHAFGAVDLIAVDAYLAKLCTGLAASMVSESHPIEIRVAADPGEMNSERAVSLGLIVTELVINAIKYAFPMPCGDARVLISYAVDGTSWTLGVADNGIGKDGGMSPHSGGGLGTIIVQALVRSLGAQMDIVSDTSGTAISITKPGSSSN